MWFQFSFSHFFKMSSSNIQELVPLQACSVSFLMPPVPLKMATRNTRLTRNHSKIHSIAVLCCVYFNSFLFLGIIYHDWRNTQQLKEKIVCCSKSVYVKQLNKNPCTSKKLQPSSQANKYTRSYSSRVPNYVIIIYFLLVTIVTL